MENEMEDWTRETMPEPEETFALAEDETEFGQKNMQFFFAPATI